MAAVTLGVVTADTGASPNTSGAFTPAVGDLLFVIVTATATAAPPAATMALTSSAGYTFVRTPTDSAGSRATTQMLLSYVATTLVTSAVSQTVSWSYPSDESTGTVICVLRISGMTLAGHAAVRQSARRDNVSAGTPDVALNRAPLTGNVMIAAVASADNPAGLTHPTGWTERADTGYASPTTGFECATIDSGFTSTTVTWNSATATTYASVAHELNTATTYQQTLPMMGVGRGP